LLAELAVQSKNQYGSPYYFAIVYVGLGENEKAMDWFDKAFAGRSNGLVFLKVEPELDNLSLQSPVHRLATEAEIPGLIRNKKCETGVSSVPTAWSSRSLASTSILSG
jgi:hypothetical protein